MCLEGWEQNHLAPVSQGSLGTKAAKVGWGWTRQSSDCRLRVGLESQGAGSQGELLSRGCDMNPAGLQESIFGNRERKELKGVNMRMGKPVRTGL